MFDLLQIEGDGEAEINNAYERPPEECDRKDSEMCCNIGGFDVT